MTLEEPKYSIPSPTMETSMPPWRGSIVAHAARLPTARPMTSRRKDSARIWVRMLRGVIPSASIRPISRTRSKTAMTRVLTRPNESARNTTTIHTTTKPSITANIDPR
jgi:hypothetical protein